VRDNLAGAAWRLGIFVTVCVLGTFALLMIFAQWRFQNEKLYRAEFGDVSGLAQGNFVRIAGVEVGKVKHIGVQSNSTVLVEFTVEDSVMITDGTKAAVRWADMIGGRYLALEEGAGSLRRLKPGDTIPVQRTQPALDVDALTAGFRPLFRALNPEQVNALSGKLIEAFQGQGGAISAFLAQTAAVTTTLADRDTLIAQVIGNLNTVLGSLGEQRAQFAKAIDAMAPLMASLAARKSDIANAAAYTNAAANSVADLFAAARPPFAETTKQTDRAAGIVLADHEYFDDLLNTLPDSYQILNRQGIYGDFFSFYLCDAVLKLNGKGGQPVYVKVAGQSTGRCAPR
jgi:phospholipid/cholesterol/gamma-HCH transport system substrate-binding protein